MSNIHSSNTQAGGRTVMQELELPVRRVLPSRWAIFILLACIVASLFITLRAGAQNSESKTGGSKAEESATIQDDPTIVPDPKESADNNITFPVDI
jgi:hypothetical protein